MTTIWAGIGSRSTPSHILELMTALARHYASKGWKLRSGGAIGADQAFERGVGTLKEIFVAEDATRDSIEIASQYHPNWDACTAYVRKLMGRNVMIMLGKNLETPVDFVMCWTEDAKMKGGTAHGIRIAQDHDIPVYNLGDREVERRARSAMRMP